MRNQLASQGDLQNRIELASAAAAIPKVRAHHRYLRLFCAVWCCVAVVECGVLEMRVERATASLARVRQRMPAEWRMHTPFCQCGLLTHSDLHQLPQRLDVVSTATQTYHVHVLDAKEWRVHTDMAERTAAELALVRKEARSAMLSAETEAERREEAVAEAERLRKAHQVSS